MVVLVTRPAPQRAFLITTSKLRCVSHSTYNTYLTEIWKPMHFCLLIANVRPLAARIKVWKVIVDSMIVLTTMVVGYVLNPKRHHRTITLTKKEI